MKLIDNIDKIHTTDMGYERIKNNLNIDNPILFCKEIIMKDDSFIYQSGKNFYVKNNDILITINSYSYTIITAKRIK
jgi:hypothetical protein